MNWWKLNRRGLGCWPSRSDKSRLHWHIKLYIPVILSKVVNSTIDFWGSASNFKLLATLAYCTNLLAKFDSQLVLANQCLISYMLLGWWQMPPQNLVSPSIPRQYDSPLYSRVWAHCVEVCCQSSNHKETI